MGIMHGKICPVCKVGNKKLNPNNHVSRCYHCYTYIDWDTLLPAICDDIESKKGEKKK
jgi:hypothetical protein